MTIDNIKYYDDPRNWDWADLDYSIPRPLREMNLGKIRDLLWKPQSKIWKVEEKPHQDEFEERSPFCTCYSAMNAYGHWFWESLPKSARENFVFFCLDNEVVFNGDRAKGERRWGNTVRTWVAFTHWFNALWATYEALPFVIEIGSWTHRWALNYGHAVSTSFIISDWFRRDRKDNLILDGIVHWGEKYNGHAILEAKYTRDELLVFNSYPDRRDSHFWVKWWDYINKYRDNDYHRKYGIIIAFRKR